MKVFKTGLKIAGVLMGATVLLFVVNIIQKGTKWDKRSIRLITGKEPEDVTVTDLKKLSKEDLFQVFYAAHAPALDSLQGEYRAETIPSGVLYFAADFYVKRLFGPGRWTGKGFSPVDDTTGWGYNLFYKPVKGGCDTLLRAKKFDTYIGQSDLAEGDSMHLKYDRYNGGLVKSMHDEIRRINDNLYIGLAHLAAGGGPINPTPFAITGLPTEFIGIDK